MTFLAALLALLFEQLRPLSSQNRVHRAMARMVGAACRQWDAGRERHAVFIWSVCTVMVALTCAAVFWLLGSVSVVLAFCWDVMVLYLCIGFRRFSHHFTAIREALEHNDEARAWHWLGRWCERPFPAGTRAELMREVMAQGVISAHRHVFGVFFWFVGLSALGLGPAGAVLYRMADFMRRDERETLDGDLAEQAADAGHLRVMSVRAFRVIDRLPSRLTAASFAIAGNFEEAVNRWRRDRDLWDDPNEGLILSAAAGATGLPLGPGDEPMPGALELEQASLQTLVGLIWRSLVLAMMLVALLTLANVLG